MKAIIKIDIGSDSMRSVRDVTNALVSLAERINRMADETRPAQRAPELGESWSVFDSKGERVGFLAFTEGSDT